MSVTFCEESVNKMIILVFDKSFIINAKIIFHVVLFVFYFEEFIIRLIVRFIHSEILEKERIVWEKMKEF